jgi:prophage regulatory protein
MSQALSQIKPPQQPLEAASNPHALLKISTVCALAGLSRATIYRLMKAGGFVEPVRLSARCIRFRAGDLTTWMSAQ